MTASVGSCFYSRNIPCRLVSLNARRTGKFHRVFIEAVSLFTGESMREVFSGRSEYPIIPEEELVETNFQDSNENN